MRHSVCLSHVSARVAATALTEEQCPIMMYTTGPDSDNNSRCRVSCLRLSARTTLMSLGQLPYWTIYPIEDIWHRCRHDKLYDMLVA